ncbi:MAG: hypothetical protein R2857_01050 [Vampirovibrionales bacterium]
MLRTIYTMMESLTAVFCGKPPHAPTESGNDRLIRDADGVNGKQVLGYAIQGDYYDNGRIDGSFLKNWFGYTYWCPPAMTSVRS